MIRASQPATSHTRRTFLAALAAIYPVVASSEMAARWDQPSALPEFSVRGLAGHLVRAALTVDTYLDRPEPTDHEPISPAMYFADLDADITSPLNIAICQRGEDLAAGGHAQLVVEVGRLTTRIEGWLARERDDRLPTVASDSTMRLDDYLVTRIVELTVHADDLAISVSLDSPVLSLAALAETSSAAESFQASGSGRAASCRRSVSCSSSQLKYSSTKSSGRDR